MPNYTKAKKIASDIVNGNRNDARVALRRAKGKTIVLDVLIVLMGDDIGNFGPAFDDLYRLLEG